MSSTRIPPDLVPTLRAYRTAELATVGRSGVPIAWPTSVLVADDGGSVLLGTSIGFPQKAHNVRREPRVALLFSDPTGSGSERLPQVLVQGTATCTDEIVTSPVGNEGYWRRLWELQPLGRVWDSTPVTRWLMDWYYMRLMITVAPGRVLTRPPADATGGLGSATDVVPGGDDAYARTVRGLAGYRNAVLAWLDDDGTPALRRVRPSGDPVRRELGLDLGADGDGDRPLRAGPASLLCHSHDEALWHLHSMVCVGRLEHRDDRWVLLPTRFVPGAGTDLPTMLRMIRQNRRTARRYLEDRSLPTPAVPWREYKAVKRGTASGSPVSPTAGG
jgi:hypothetical protein